MSEALSFDEHVGRNVRELRESMGITQTHLAEVVMERVAQGAPPVTTTFRQQTIDKIERGLRPLKLQEAITLASALECDVEVLCETERLVFDRALNTRRLITEFLKAEEAWEKSVGRVVDLQVFIAHNIEGHEEDLPPDVVKQARYLAEHDLVEHTRSVIANHQAETLHTQLDLAGVRIGHPSRYDTRP